MATDIVTDQSPEPASEGAGVPLNQLPRYTPEDHEKAACDLKVIRLVELGNGAHGKTATFEFTGGFVRSVDVDAKTVWHSALKEIRSADWRRLLEHVAPRSKCADGTQRVQIGPMPFWTQRTTARGRELSTNYFDVADELYWAGQLTGAMAARELILFLRQYERARQGDQFVSLESGLSACLRSAAALANRTERRDRHVAGQHHAADAFSTLVTRYFMCGAAYANPAYLGDQVERNKSYLDWIEKCSKESRLEFAERMRAARAAKLAKSTCVSTTPSEIERGQPRNARSKHIEGAASNGHTLQ